MRQHGNKSALLKRVMLARNKSNSRRRNAETRNFFCKSSTCCVREREIKKAAPARGTERHTRFRPGDCGSRGGEGFALPHLRRLDGGDEQGGLESSSFGGCRREGEGPPNCGLFALRFVPRGSSRGSWIPSGLGLGWAFAGPVQK